MSTKPDPAQAATKTADSSVPQPAARPGEMPAPAVDVSSSEQRATAPWIDAVGPSGLVRATKEIPEPDSLGG
jgi:hypothetical protein